MTSHPIAPMTDAEPQQIEGPIAVEPILTRLEAIAEKPAGMATVTLRPAEAARLLDHMAVLDMRWAASETHSFRSASR